MIRLKDTHHQNTAAFLDSAIKIAEYYGFVPIEILAARRNDSRKRASARRMDSEISFARRDERTLLGFAPLSACARAEVPKAAPSSLAHQPCKAAIPDVARAPRDGRIDTIAEALLIVVASTIAEEAGIKKRVLSINNIGAPDSSDASSAMSGSTCASNRIHQPDPASARGEDPLGTLVQLIERGHPAVSRAPQAMEYLTEEERHRFWELLEYLEVFGLPYELSGQILGSRDCWAHSLFDLSTTDTETRTRPHRLRRPL